MEVPLCGLIYIIPVVEATEVCGNNSSDMDGTEGVCMVADDTVASVKEKSRSCEEGIVGIYIYIYIYIFYR